MYLLDTVICIQLLAGNHTTIGKLEKLDGSASISAINAGELLCGAYNSKRVTENITAVLNLLELVGDVYEIDTETVWVYGRLKAEIMKRFAPKERQRQRKFRLESLGFFDNDLWIASTAIQHDLTLVSQDDDFKHLQGLENLKVDIW